MGGRTVGIIAGPLRTATGYQGDRIMRFDAEIFLANGLRACRRLELEAKPGASAAVNLDGFALFVAVPSPGSRTLRLVVMRFGETALNETLEIEDGKPVELYLRIQGVKVRVTAIE